MEILVERTETELEQQGETLFRQDSVRWFLAYTLIFLLVAASIIAESSITTGPGELAISIGGPVSTLGVVGGALLLAYDFQVLRARRQICKALTGNEISFCHLTDSGIEFGMRDVSTRFASWIMISQIMFRRKSIDFRMLDTLLVLKVHHFTPAQLQEMRNYFAGTREIIEPQPFFGWRRTRKEGREVYGRCKR